MRYILFLVLLLSTKVFADTSLPPQEILRIETGWGAEGIYINFKDGIPAEGCPGTAVRIPADHPMLDHILSLSLSAFLSGKRAQFRVSGCPGGGVMIGTAVSIG